jgi:pantoate--beta-alanine ligase
MKTLHDLDAIKAACRAAATAGTLGFVPTMGALHEGHLSLVARAAEQCDRVAVSIYVNPLQFGPGEDFEAYPRDAEGDARRLEAAGADLVLLLTDDQMYPAGFATRVFQPDLTTSLEGEARPGHFDGVLTVVTKLLNIVGAQRAYFGQKDFQQLLVIRRLVTDLDIPTAIVACPTVRDADGLALSSRNAYLDADQRRAGLSLVSALAAAQDLFAAGERAPAVLEGAMERILTEGLGRAPDYARVVDASNLAPPESVSEGDVALVAGPVGPTRLIDNHLLGARIGPFPASS